MQRHPRIPLGYTATSAETPAPARAHGHWLLTGLMFLLLGSLLTYTLTTTSTSRTQRETASQTHAPDPETRSTTKPLGKTGEKYPTSQIES